LGQHVNKISTSVEITHLPSGVTATAADSRSQQMNRRLAIERLLDRIEAERAATLLARRAAAAKSAVSALAVRPPRSAPSPRASVAAARPSSSAGASNRRDARPATAGQITRKSKDKHLRSGRDDALPFRAISCV
jgi:protein subunit release factor B